MIFSCTNTNGKTFSIVFTCTKNKENIIHWKEVIVVIMFKLTTSILSQKPFPLDNESD